MRNSFIKKYQNNSLVFFITLFLVLTIGISYAFFSYNQVGNNNQLIAGNIYMHYNEMSKGISLQGALPESDDIARGRNDNYMTFTIDGVNTTKDKDIYYEILLSYGNDISGKNRLNDEHLKFDLEETTIIDGTETTNTVLTGVSFNEINNTRIWVNTIDKNTDSEITITYKLRMWISDEVWISDTDTGADYTMSVYQNSYASIRVNVYGDFVEKKIRFLYNEIEKNMSSFLLADDGDARIIYGNKSNITNNYVWYSGKLWRVVALNNDGSVKLVTEQQISLLNYGNSSNFEGSWVYQWLNEDFLDTLYNNEDFIVEDYLWNATQMQTTDKPENTTMVKSKVGLLNLYEYTQSYKNTTGYAGYLNNSFYWYLLTPSNANSIWRTSGNYTDATGVTGNPLGVRPSINLVKNIRIESGDGSSSNPYTLMGDISLDESNSLLNNRVSGEYVKFDGKKYRIVGIENGLTKISMVDVLKDETETKISKYLASSILYGAKNNTKSNDYWDYYLNNTWYNSISTGYKRMIVKSNWYLGSVSATSYKNGICESSNTIQTVKNCKKTSNIYNGYIGLGRIGEMFTSQIDCNYYDDSSTYIWTLTPKTTILVWQIDESGFAINNLPESGSSSVRPSMFLNSNVKIISGLGTKQSPFEIELES